MKNRDLWAKVVIRTADFGSVDIEKTITELRRYVDLQQHDQAAMAEAIDSVCKEYSAHEFITTPNLLKVAAMRLTQDFGLWSELEDRGREVLKAKYTSERKNGIRNPHFVPAAPTA
jgi:hypothetical protein